MSTDTWQLLDEPEDTLCLVHERNLDKFPQCLNAHRTTLNCIQLCRLHIIQNKLSSSHFCTGNFSKRANEVQNKLPRDELGDK